MAFMKGCSRLRKRHPIVPAFPRTFRSAQRAQCRAQRGSNEPGPLSGREGSSLGRFVEEDKLGVGRSRSSSSTTVGLARAKSHRRDQTRERASNLEATNAMPETCKHRVKRDASKKLHRFLRPPATVCPDPPSSGGAGLL